MLQTNEIIRSYGKDYKAMTIALLEATGAEELLAERGGRDLRIGIKPNLVTASPAEFGGTTHTQILEGIIEYLRSKGYENLLILEGSWVGDKTADAFEYCGYNSLSARTGVPLKDLQKDGFFERNCGGMKLLLCNSVKDVDFLINVPVLKGHCQTRMTCALKNLKGLLPNREKRRFHVMGLHKPIAHLNAGIKQDLIVVDHICGDPDFEEGGNPLVRDCVMVARDPVLVDAYACRLLGYETEDVPYVGLAEKLGVGSADLSRLVMRDLTESGSEDLPRSHRILEVSYAAEEADSCSACYGELTGALIRLKEEGLLDKLPGRLSIGQGFRGRSGNYGIGNCTCRFASYVPGCPPKEEDIYNFLKSLIEG